MREIKFKALMKRRDGRYFVSESYGSDSGFLSYLFDFENNRWDKFLETITTSVKFLKIFKDDDEYLKGWTHIGNLQYTGLKDKNGKDIFEGDICRCRGGYEHNGHYQYDEVYEVKWQGAGFDMVRDNCGYGWGYTINIEIIEVVGNIYESKHLLED